MGQAKLLFDAATHRTVGIYAGDLIGVGINRVGVAFLRIGFYQVLERNLLLS